MNQRGEVSPNCVKGVIRGKGRGGVQKSGVKD